MSEFHYFGEQDEYGPFEVGKDGLPDFTDLVIFFLNRMGWSVEQFGQLYGQAVKNKPYSKERMYQMIREKSFPHDPKRRLVIAKLLQIPPLFFVPPLEDLIPHPPEPSNSARPSKPSVKRRGFDLEEYRATLKTLQRQYHTNPTPDPLNEIKARIRYLHDEVLYKAKGEAKSIKQLICGYQMAAGNILRDQYRAGEALNHLSKAVFLARSNHYTDTLVDGLVMRGVLFLDLGKVVAATNASLANRHFTRALNDFEEARLYLNQVELSQQGTILLLSGTTRAHQAQDKIAFTQALRDVEWVGDVVLPNSAKDKGIYYLDFAASFIAAPDKALHDPISTFSALKEAEKYVTPELPRRYAYMHIIEASAHLDKNWYPTATSLAMEALTMTRNAQSILHLSRIAGIHERLKGSSFGKSEEVAELGIGLLKAQYPHLFQ